MHAVPMKKVPDRNAAIASALRTVTTEQAGVAALAEALNDGLSEAFGRAIELWRRLPLGLTQLIGPPVAKHLG